MTDNLTATQSARHDRFYRKGVALLRRDNAYLKGSDNDSGDHDWRQLRREEAVLGIDWTKLRERLNRNDGGSILLRPVR